MISFFKTFCVVVALGASASTLSAQDTKAEARPEPTEMTPDERRAAFAQRIDATTAKYKELMGEHAPTADQLEAFNTAIAKSMLDQMRLRTEMRKVRQSMNGKPNREVMRGMRERREAVDAALLKSMRKILSKKQYKAFKAAKSEIQPERRPRGGQGRNGGGNRGGGRGG